MVADLLHTGSSNSTIAGGRSAIVLRHARTKLPHQDRPTSMALNYWSLGMTRRWLRIPLATPICIALLGFAGTTSHADGSGTCDRTSLGQTSCMSSTLCECIYDRGGSITGTPPGYRWDCGNLRPTCGESANPPATMNEYKGPYPLAIGIDRSNQNIGIK
jgi:hypothetical protein